MKLQITLFCFLYSICGLSYSFTEYNMSILYLVHYYILNIRKRLQRVFAVAHQSQLTPSSKRGKTFLVLEQLFDTQNVSLCPIPFDLGMREKKEQIKLFTFNLLHIKKN